LVADYTGWPGACLLGRLLAPLENALIADAFAIN
jgi:hypothetical protein